MSCIWFIELFGACFQKPEVRTTGILRVSQVADEFDVDEVQ